MISQIDINSVSWVFNITQCFLMAAAKDCTYFPTLIHHSLQFCHKRLKIKPLRQEQREMHSLMDFALCWQCTVNDAQQTVTACGCTCVCCGTCNRNTQILFPSQQLYSNSNLRVYSWEEVTALNFRREITSDR